MALNPHALQAAAEAEARYDGYDDLLSFSKTMRERYIDRASAAVLAYQEVMKGARLSGAHKIAMAIRDIEEGKLSAVHFNGQTWRPVLDSGSQLADAPSKIPPLKEQG